MKGSEIEKGKAFQIKAIILDVDNTLIQFSQVAAKCFQETAQELNLKKYSLEKISKQFGKPAKKFIPEFWPKANLKEFYNLVLKKIKTKKVKPLPYALTTLKKLSKNYKLGLLSSKPKILMYPHLKQTKIPTNLFQFIYSADDVKYPKPDPKVFTKPLRKLNLPKKEILYIGDTIFDCLSAKKAKLKFVAVLTGHYTKKDFQKQSLKNTNILKSIKDLPKWLNENNKQGFNSK